MKKKLLDQHVLDVMRPRRAYKPDDIDTAIRHIFYENQFALGDYQTIATALKHLLKAGKITRKLHSRGWFNWYTYSKAETENAPNQETR